MPSPEKTVAPRSILLFERIHYDWLHPELIARMQTRFETKFTILTPRNATAKRRESVLDANGELLYMEDIEAALPGISDDEAVYAAARRFERLYAVSYLRDIIQQDRWLSSGFAGYASNSYFAARPAPALVNICHQINHYFEYFGALFDKRAIDCVVGWPSYSLMTSVATFIARSRGIPTTFLTPGRQAFRLMWSDGPFVGPGLIDRAMASVVGAPERPPPRKLPADTQAALDELPREMHITTVLRRIYELTRDHAIWRAADLLRMRRSDRPGYIAGIRRHVRDWLALHRLRRHSVGDMGRLAEFPYVFFPLPYEPEFPNTSLAREFNDTLAFVKQCAMALPAGYRLVVKEHVVGVGHRPSYFLDEILRQPNVVLAANHLRGIDLVERAAAVATLNGTAGLEAAYFGKKALLFSMNVEYAGMPHVIYVRDLRDLPAYMQRAVDPAVAPKPAEILASAARHHVAMTSMSVDVSHIDVFGGNKANRLEDEEYAFLVDRLVDTFDFLRAKPAARPA